MGKGRSLELYFIDGKPDGMLTAEVFNWTGHVLMTPRTRLLEAFAHMDHTKTGYTGVYILFGEGKDRPRAYIGESENVRKRLLSHEKKSWEVAVLITSTANKLNKAHVKYLESRLITMAEAANPNCLENKTFPPSPSLSVASTTNMESFLDTLMMVLPAIQVDMFVDKSEPPKSNSDGSNANNPIFQLNIPKRGVFATAELRDGEMVVQSGSIAYRAVEGHLPNNAHYKTLYAKLVESGVLELNDKNAVFTKDYRFRSPSAAGGIVSGRATNGRKEWKLKDEKTSYAEWEHAKWKSAQLDQMEPE